MPPSDSQSFLRESDKNGAERHGRPSNVARRGRAGARIKLRTAAEWLRSKLPPATEIQTDRRSSARSYKISSTGKLIDDARDANLGLRSDDTLVVRRFKRATRVSPIPDFYTQDQHPDLAPNRAMALLLANGSMSSNSSGEGDVRRVVTEANPVECMIKTAA